MTQKPALKMILSYEIYSATLEEGEYNSTIITKL
jgi:hypothetical protein